MENIVPKALKRGDKIRIIATARAVDQKFIDNAIKIIDVYGFEVDCGRNLFAKSDQFAGSDIERIQDLNDAIADPSVRAIFCARGGYGTARILDKMDLNSFRKDPKWICGYSDVTALHSHVFTKTSIQSVHSTMPVNFESNSKKSLDSLFELISGNAVNYEFNSHPLQVNGTTEGEIVGGNLSVLYSLIGSDSSLNTNGKILFLEDLDEYLYHIDRMFLNLRRSSFLSGLKGIIVGGMTDMNDNAIPYGLNVAEIIIENCKSLSIPIAFNFQSGHLDENLAWIHGKKIRLTVKNDQPSRIEYLN